MIKSILALPISYVKPTVPLISREQGVLYVRRHRHPHVVSRAIKPYHTHINYSSHSYKPIHTHKLTHKTPPSPHHPISSIFTKLSTSRLKTTIPLINLLSTTTISTMNLFNQQQSSFSSSFPSFSSSSPEPMSTATHRVLTDETQFDTTLATSFTEAKENNQQLYVYITGAIVPETGKSWCPDCTSAKPNVERLTVTPGNFVIECPLERAKYRGIPVANCNPDEGCKIEKHPYKASAKLALTAIPTLYKINMDDLEAPYERLVESDVYNDSKFNAFTGLQ